MTKLTKQRGFAPLIALAIVGIGILAGFIGSKLNKSQPATQSTPNFGTFDVSGGGTYRLKSTAASTDTTIHLSSFKEPISNIPYSMSYLGSNIAFGTLDPQQPTRSEFISFSGITQNSDGSADLTGVIRGIPRTPSASTCTTASTTLEQAHAGQSIFILSNSPCFYEQFVIKQNNQSITGLWNFASTSLPTEDKFASSTKELEFVTFKQLTDGYLDMGTSSSQTIVGKKIFTVLPQSATVPSTGNDLTNKTYVDGVAIAGAANASQSTKGIVQEATVAQINAGTAAGSTGAELYVNPAQLLSSIVASSTTNYATTSAQVLATSTISKIPTNDILNFFFHSTSTVVITKGTTVPGFDTQACITFNTFSGSSLYSYNYREILGNTTDGAAAQTGSKLCVSPQGAGQGTEVLIRGTVMNKSGLWKNGSVEVQYTSNAGATYQNFTNFTWKDTSQITSISFDTASTTAGFATSTYINAY